MEEKEPISRKCLNPWDVQSKHIQSEDGIAEALYSGEHRYGGGEQYVLQGCSWQGGQISPTLTGSNAGGSQRMPDKDNFTCVIQSENFDDPQLKNGQESC